MKLYSKMVYIPILLIIILIIYNYFYLDSIMLLDSPFFIYLFFVFLEVLLLKNQNIIKGMIGIISPTIIFTFLYMFFNEFNKNSSVAATSDEGSLYVLFAMLVILLVLLPLIQVIIFIFKVVRFR